VEVDAIFEAEAAEGELLGAELDEAGLGGEDGEEIADATGVVGAGGFVGLGGEGGGGVDGGGAFGEEAFGGEGVFDFAEGFEDGLLELGEGFVLFGVADFGFGAELAAGEEGLDDVAGELPDAEVAVEEFGEVAGGGTGAGGEGEAGEEGAAGFGEAFAAGGEAAFGGEDVGAALEEFGGESGGDLAGDGGEFGGGELAGGVAAEEDFELAGAAFEGLLAFDAGCASGGGVGFGEAELGGGAAVFLLAAEEAFADGVGGFLEDGFGFGGEGDLFSGFGEGEPGGGDLGGDGGLGGADVLGGGFGFGGGGGLAGADAAPDIEFPVDGGGEVELVEGVGEDGTGSLAPPAPPMGKPMKFCFWRLPAKVRSAVGRPAAPAMRACWRAWSRRAAAMRRSRLLRRASSTRARRRESLKRVTQSVSMPARASLTACQEEGTSRSAWSMRLGGERGEQLGRRALIRGPQRAENRRGSERVFRPDTMHGECGLSSEALGILYPRGE
jgi:hypothetical protein